jgi:hypothetical protein
MHFGYIAPAIVASYSNFSTSLSPPAPVTSSEAQANRTKRQLVFLTSFLSQSSQTAFLNLGQRPAATQESYNSHNTGGWKSLEEVPAGVVQKENPLHCQY